MSIKFVPGLAKTRAIPSLYRDYFLAKEPGQQPVLASGNAYYHNRRAVRFQAWPCVTIEPKNLLSL